MKKKELEQELNSLYSTMDKGEALDMFKYLGSRTIINKHYNGNALGSLLRKKDPVTFDIIHQEKLKEQWNN